MQVYIFGVFVGVFALVTGAYYLLVLVPEQRGQSAVRRRRPVAVLYGFTLPWPTDQT